MMRWLFGLLAMLALTVSAAEFGSREVAVPEPLKPWRDWALHGEEFRRCPLSHGQQGNEASDFACVWYGSLRLEADGKGARFSLPIEVLGGRETAVVLPGDRERWPRNLSDGIRAVPVVERNGLPVLLLGPGKLTVQGEFRWRELPGSLKVPASLALIDLRLNGRAIAQPQRESEALILSSGETAATVQDTLQLRVFQLLRDGLPLQLETVLMITATGSAREVVVGKPLQEGFVPVGMASKLAARLDEQGQLRLQLRAGDWQLRLQSRAEQLPAELSLRSENGLWPTEEIWSWQSGERLRAASLEGGAPIDPVQVDVPNEWQQLPAVRVNAGETLRIAERSRGRQVTDNALQLNRQLWLRFDGSAYAFRDEIQGSLRSDWRLEMAVPYQLMQVSDSGSALPISSLTATEVTAASEQRGVELRNGYVNLQASGELAPTGILTETMPATGWQNRFDGAQLQLHLPPGYRLLTAQGVDSAPNSFLERWNLLDTFVLVLTAVLIFKLYGVIWSLLMLIGFAMLFHEPDMPVWLLPNAALALLACRYATGKLAVWLARYRALSLAALLLILVPFAAGQISALLHPQLESRDAYYGGPGGYEPTAALMEAVPAASPAYENAQEQASEESDAADEQRIEVTGSRVKRTDIAAKKPKIYQTYADNSISQAGNGIPEWQWRSYHLYWSGPVDANQEVSLWILPYGARIVLILAAIGIFAGWFLRIARELTGVQPLLFAKEKLGLAIVPFLLISLLLAPALMPPPANAEMPSEAMLDELKARLIAAPVCAPVCADVESASVRASRDQIELTLEVNALVPSAIPVPGRVGDWLPTSVSRDGERSVARMRGNALQVWLPAGKHRLQLLGPTSGSDRLTLAFPLKPRRIELQLDGWEASGMQGDSLPSSSLALTRSARLSAERDGSGKAGANGITQLSVPPFVQIERTLSFADEWRVDTRVIRLAPAHGAFSLSLPLLSGEAVLDNTLKAEAGLLQLDFAGSETSKSFSSTLARAEQLQLAAPSTVPYVEIWQLAPDNQWRVQADGTPQIANEDGADWIQTFAPRPGETLNVKIFRPTILAGATLAIDSVQLQHEQGQRGSNGNLTLRYRATQGGEQALKLPADLELMQLTLDGREQTLRPRDGVLTVPVLPGEHHLLLNYRDNKEVSWQQGVPAFALGLPAANIQYSVAMPESRWILFASGPRLGPAVRYWSALLVFVALAFVLARSGLTSLPFRDWLLLGLGLSTVSWWVLALLVGWFVALRWREKQLIPATGGGFNLQQVALFGFSIVAVLVLVGSVPAALLSSPDMMLVGNDSYGHQLNWFADYSSNELPAVSVISAPMWLYKGSMLLWAIWLSFALLRWVKLAWQALQVGGLWQSKPVKVARASVGGEPPAADASVIAPSGSSDTPSS